MDCLFKIALLLSSFSSSIRIDGILSWVLRFYKVTVRNLTIGLNERILLSMKIKRLFMCVISSCLLMFLFPWQMHQQGILKTDDLITRFFRLCTEMCVEISYRAQAEQQHNPAANPTMIRAKCYHNLDAFVRLIALLVKHSGEATNTVTKINLLNKV